MKKNPNMKAFWSLFVLTMVCVFHSCEWMLEKGFSMIILSNYSGQPIATYAADGLYSDFSYPDTTPPTPLRLERCTRENIVSGTIVYDILGGRLSDLLSHTNEGVLSIYVFSQDDIDAYGWDEVFCQKKYLVRYDIKEEDFAGKSEVFYISYPPGPEMKDVQMSPPYDSFH